MRTPCEWTLSEFVPKVKSRLAEELTKTGKNQKEIASLLGISQARVSQYLKRSSVIERPIDPGPLKLLQYQFNDVLERTVSKLVSELTTSFSPALSIPIICSGCRELRTGNAICTLHKFDYPELGKILENRNCDLCLKWKTSTDRPSEIQLSTISTINQLDGRIDVLRHLENLVDNLTQMTIFINYVPQIGAQLCMYNDKSGEEELRNVAGYPGRIIKFQNQAKTLSNPQYNVSKTTAELLLGLRKFGFRSLTTVLSIKNNNIEQLDLTGYTIIDTYEGDKTGFIEQIKVKNKDTRKLALLDSGSIGYEPISYFFVANPDDLLVLFS